MRYQFNAIDTTCYLHGKSIAHRWLLSLPVSIAVLITAWLGVLVLISHYLHLLCFSLGWLLAVTLLFVIVLLLLCGS